MSYTGLKILNWFVIAISLLAIIASFLVDNNLIVSIFTTLFWALIIVQSIACIKLIKRLKVKESGY